MHVNVEEYLIYIVCLIHLSITLVAFLREMCYTGYFTNFLNHSTDVGY